MVGLREFGDEKGDVILKFYDEEAKELKELGEIPEHVKINEGDFDFDQEGEYVGEEEKEEDDFDVDTVKINLTYLHIDLRAWLLHDNAIKNKLSLLISFYHLTMLNPIYSLLSLFNSYFLLL